VKFVIFLIPFLIEVLAAMPKFSVLALQNGKWNLFVCENGKCKKINTEYEIRNYDVLKNRIIYLGADDNIRIKEGGDERVLLKAGKDSYRQPFFYNQHIIVLVRLKNKNSKKTDIISINMKKKKLSVLHDQYSTSLDPYIYENNLYYSNVNCVNGCGHIIQEIWVKNLKTGRAKQLTLRNTISFQPSVNKNRVYFSSLQNGKYQIFEYDLNKNETKRVTKSKVNDLYPNAYENGVLFIRENGDKSFVYKIEKGKTSIVPLNIKYTKLRDLRVVK